MTRSNVRLNCCGRFSHALTGLLPSLVILLGPTARSHAQGTIAFNNLANNNYSMYARSGGLAYLYGPPSTPWPFGWEVLAKDINFSIEAGPSADLGSLRPIHTWLIGDGSASGIAVGGGRFADPSGGVYAIPGVTPGSEAFFVLKAWEGNFGSYETAGQWTTRVSFWNPTGGGGGPAASLVGMPSLNVGPIEVDPAIPEPTSLALLSVGGAVLLVWRRRRV